VRLHDVPRTELRAPELGLAVQANLFDLFRAFARLPDAELEESGRCSRHHAFPGNPMFKGVWNLGEVDAVEESLAWLASRGAPFGFVWAGPGTEPDGLRVAMERNGIPPWELDAPGMAAELDALDWEALERVPAGFRIDPVRDDEALVGFARTAMGQPVYARIGFAETGTGITRYLWRPSVR
jgi:hypothetical protein